ncbi:hypothetical protein [Rhizobium leguminosarum]|uniref:hypothetical protein n=1 Tax=Rhizobium leguminosarum TaxID=384 RepID=UPI001C981F04|nr:hypothetical protein [Rhizobium leguminosarum]MBY5662604.1 hypothetical protein [Rhizobium leguminosarum]MBY5679773.1 hypothetical protein [Rhizobium leguminosarum]
MIERTEATDTANRLVGRFLQHFSLVEAALDKAITTLTGLNWSVAAALTANTPFVKKVDFLFLTEAEVSEKADHERKRFLRDTRSAILRINDNRVIAAHCGFDHNQVGSIIFRRVTANQTLKISDVIWTEANVEEMCAIACELVKTIETIVDQMVPFKHKLDFSDSRNSGYATLLF